MSDSGFFIKCIIIYIPYLKRSLKIWTTDNIYLPAVALAASLPASGEGVSPRDFTFCTCFVGSICLPNAIFGLST